MKILLKNAVNDLRTVPDSYCQNTHGQVCTGIREDMVWDFEKSVSY